MDNKQGSTTCSFLDITDGSQHEVKTTDNTDWLLIEDFGQVNRRLVESLGQWKGKQYAYEYIQELYDDEDPRVKKSMVRKSKKRMFSVWTTIL